MISQLSTYTTSLKKSGPCSQNEGSRNTFKMLIGKATGKNLLGTIIFKMRFRRTAVYTLLDHQRNEDIL